MSTTRNILSGLSGLAAGGFWGATIGAASGFIGGTITKNLKLIDSPTSQIAYAGALGWTLLGGGIFGYLGYKNLSSKLPEKNNEYDKAGAAALLTTVAGISGSLILKSLKQPQPSMGELIPTMLIGATLFHYGIDWFVENGKRKEEIAPTQIIRM